MKSEHGTAKDLVSTVKSYPNHELLSLMRPTDITTASLLSG